MDAIWLSPFYPSELADGGYDVIDYRNVDPRLGTLEDFDELVTALHAHGMKIVVDIVPNHTSNMHEWFQAALTAEPGSPERDRYIFREGRGEHGELPPNDWQSLFGGRPGNAWPTANGICTSSQWSSRTNWKNPEVHEDFKKTLRFWSDRGVDGFRIDVAHGLAKISTANPSPRWTRTACSTPTIAMGTTRCGAAPKCTTSTVNGTPCSMNTGQHASPSARHG
ncbi:alpha-amylase family glycosyl hydrolase [Bifidobacterium animalis]|uniref:alpha-amylase family glycosyl hydrolase n=1 Tax=Bifidobacterium animalis TaxID=28025 RepID=UPI002ADFB297|nr:alpha-amylase family glycosyl hydrolase [Bifidobacterium animalis]